MLRYGNGAGKAMKSDWKKEVESIDSDRVPNEKSLLFVCLVSV